jgi:YfiR/HmsC-like
MVTAASTPTDYEVKAAYLNNFGKFVQWPESLPAPQSNTFAICVLGQDPFGSILDNTVVGATVDGKTVVARRIATAEQATDCRIVFISASESSAWRTS